jgi:hypothetical protein
MISPSPDLIYDILSEYAPEIQAELEIAYRKEPTDFLNQLLDGIHTLSVDNATEILDDLFLEPTVNVYSRYLSNYLADQIVGRFFDAGFVPLYISQVSPSQYQLSPVQFTLSPTLTPPGTPIGPTESGTLLATPLPTPPQTPPLSPSYPVSRPDIGTAPINPALLPPAPVYARSWEETPESAYLEMPVNHYRVLPPESINYNGRQRPQRPQRQNNSGRYGNGRNQRPGSYPNPTEEIRKAIIRSGLRYNSRRS